MLENEVDSSQGKAKIVDTIEHEKIEETRGPFFIIDRNFEAGFLSDLSIWL